MLYSSLCNTWGKLQKNSTANFHNYIKGCFRSQGVAVVSQCLFSSTIAVITIGIKDDLTPELNELVVVQLTNPKSGALLDPLSSSVNVVIVANDNVGGVLGFTSSSFIAKEGKNSFAGFGRCALLLLGNPALIVNTAQSHLHVHVYSMIQHSGFV